MKVALVSTLPPINTSLSEYGKFLVEGLHDVGTDLEIDVLADVPEESLSSEGIKEMNLPGLRVMRSWKFNAWSTPFKLLFKIMALRPDVVVFNTQFASFGNKKIPAMLGLSAPMLLKQMGFKVVTILHNLPEAMELDQPYFAKGKFDKFLIQAGGSVATRLLLKSDRLVVTLDKYKDILQKKYKATNVDVIGLGSYIEPAKEVYIPQKNSYLTFGKFGTYKRLEFLLDAFEELSQKHPEIELVIGGADHPSTPGYMDAIEQKYAHLKNVRFIGWIEDEDLPNVIRECRALILSYESTAGSSGPLHLAASQGKAIVAPDFGDFKLVARQEGASLMFYSHKNAFDFKQKLETLITNQVDLKSIGAQNLNMAQLHSSEKTARHYLNLLEEVIDKDHATLPQDDVDNIKIDSKLQEMPSLFRAA